MKYVILKEDTIDYEGITLYRIQNEETGELGGYIEHERNLSRLGKCWVSDKAIVYGHAQINGDAQIRDYAQVYGHAQIGDNAQIYGCAQVYGHAEVYDNAQVGGDAEVYGDAKIYGGAKIYGESNIHNCARIKNASVNNCVIDAHVSIQCDVRLEAIHIQHCTGHIETR
jgi:NDP-sugar pyrophosphorylase family protein